VIVEAMLSGRIPIVTDVAGNAEVVEDGVSGFLAATPTIAAFDEALERAWQRRGEWQAMGKVAAERIRTLVPKDPPRTFADVLIRVAEGEAIGVRQPAGESVVGDKVRQQRALEAKEKARVRRAAP
jgi:glycosyltransferase involved in cell wall biosynthesis